MTTLAEKWMAEGEAKGRAEAKAERIAKDKAEALRIVLRSKFGELPHWALAAGCRYAG